MTTLAAMRREQYARYQPLFGRPAAVAPDKHRTYLGRLVASDEVITLVSEEAGQLTGFLIAALNPAPPVYDPAASPAISTTSWSPRPPDGRRPASGCYAPALPKPGGAAPFRQSS